MVLERMQMMNRSQVLCICVLLCACCRAFELQDTIHALIEENIQLHDQLENLTRALRELRQLLFHHSDDQHHDHAEDLQHLWDEWSQHTITPETHLLLEQALCGHDVHGSAPSVTRDLDVILLLLLLLLAFITLLHPLI